jgi:hypothetical protein
MISPTMETQLAALLDVLDEDIRHMESTLSRLDTLRSLVIKREDAALERLLDEIRQQADAYRSNEQKRQQLRRGLAAGLGCPEGDLTLSKLRDELVGQARAAVADRQVRLQALAARLKREHTLTVLLLRDCTRFNRSLLQAFFGSGGRGGTTYSPSGAAKHQTGASLVSMKL